MERRTFVQLATALGAWLLAPFAGWARRTPWDRTTEGFVVGRGKARTGNGISLFEGDTFYTKVSTKDTNGDIYMFESNRVKKGGPPLHYHHTQDEWWYVLEGEFLFKVGEATYTVGPGDSVFGPRMVPHAFAKINEGAARLLMFFQPAGKMEEHFTMTSEGKFANLSDAERNAVRERNGVTVVGPALTYLKQ